jgi:endonuclease/exonuclease/phosphatase family metal-dependent hydrolase
MRKSNNVNVTPAIAQYLDLYPHEIKDVKDVVSYCQDISTQIGTASAGIYKVRIMSHNVGKFNYGNSGGYSGDDVAQKLLDWKNMYSKLEPDILCGQENVLYFDANQTIRPANDLFAPLFPEYFNNGNYATFIRSKPALNSKTDISLSVTVGGTTYTRNASTAIIVMNGINILVVSTHFSPGYTADDETARGLQADALITALSGYDHVIICGDFNSSEETFFSKFKTAGYMCVNHGYWGVINTLPNESVDNIICKGFVPYNIICNSEDKCTSDHYPVVSDLYLDAN